MIEWRKGERMTREAATYTTPTTTSATSGYANGITVEPSNGTKQQDTSPYGPYQQAAAEVTGAANGITAPSSSNAMTSGTAVRNAMVSAGLSNDNIGWNANTGMVTYNGTDILKPDSVVDGVSYANQDAINAAVAQILNEQGLTGVRNTLVSRGINNEDIDWNDATKNITYKGKDIYAPQNIVDGKSYASEQDINRLTNEIYKMNGDELVSAKYNGGESGLSNIVQWSDGKCLVGGQEIDVKYVDDDGTAMVSKKELEDLLAQYKEDAGLMSDKDVYDDWYNKYNSDTQEALDKILNRDDWDYDPYDDPAYLAYKDQYEREGNRAYQDAYASMAGGTGGYGNSAAVTAGGQQLNYYMQQLADRVPELEQNSWNRYVDDQNLNIQALQELRETGNNDYNKLYTANNDAYDRINAANDTAYERNNYESYDVPIQKEEIKQAYEETAQAQEATKQAQYKTEQEKQNTEMGQIDADYYETLMKQQVDRGDVEIKQLVENLDIQEYTDAFDAAYLRGYFNEDEAKIIGYEQNFEKYPYTNGYPYPREGAAISDLEFWKDCDMIQFNDQQDKILEVEKAKIEAQGKEDRKTAAFTYSLANG